MINKILSEYISSIISSIVSNNNKINILHGFERSLIAQELIVDNTILVAPEQTALALFHNLKIIGKNPLFLPEPYIIPYENKPPESIYIGYRIDALYKYLSDSSRPLVTTPEAIKFPVIHPEVLKKSSISISIGQELDTTELASQLARIGYIREDVVEILGSFAMRGDIIDIFSPFYPDPVRIELDWDEVKSIRLFAAENQISYDKLTKAEILPPSEFVFETGAKTDMENQDESFAEGLNNLWTGKLKNNMSLGDTGGLLEFYADKVMVFDYDEIFALAETFDLKARSIFGDLSGESDYIDPDKIFPSNDRLKEQIGKKAILIESMDGEAHEFAPATKAYYSNIISPSFDPANVFIVTKSPAGNDILNRIINEYPSVKEIKESFHGGFCMNFDGEKYAFITDKELVRRPAPSVRVHKYRESTAFMFTSELEKMDLVVHQDHGIGRFHGLETIDFKGRPSECIKLEYADDQKLLVPVEDFHLVQKYYGSPDTAQLSKLGGVGWKKTKKKAADNIRTLAGELLHLYALRQTVEGDAQPGNKEFMDILDASFPYEPTDDQAKAFDDIERDLIKPHPTDRLICGDVGFGKTEVAVRAAARVASGGKQVAVLVPTTVLAQQHYNTFTERLKDLPVKIGTVSRFVTPKDQKVVLEALAKGLVDIIIGTHRLLSKDVQFRDIGLLIVDEEQKFGVAHKERIKQFRTNIDVLTLTATPIPRTLSFSLGGLRDLSIIATPPEHRMPIFTKMISFNDEVIRDAIEKEIDRGGQVFFLHNRVQTIRSMYDYLKLIVPHLKIGIAHGQMPSKELSKVMKEFRHGKYQILLTTTVIEAGTDIPTVNTIIINRADKFGISDLYQLRGRVGRSDIQAYAYLITPPYNQLGSKARKRLKAILSHTQLGSGFSLSMRDLEIRGAGDILGKKQSGVVSQIGMSLYSKMLSQTVSQLKNQGSAIFIPPPVEMDFSLAIPKEYISSSQIRIQMYQRFFTASSEDELRKLFAEIEDRFGELPEEMTLIREYLRVRIVAGGLPVSSVTMRGNTSSIVFRINESPTLFELTKGVINNKLIAGFDFCPNMILKIRRGEDELDDLSLLNRALKELRTYYIKKAENSGSE